MAFVCGHCKTRVTTPPDLEQIPNAHEMLGNAASEIYANHVFTPCGHVFHLGCIAETFFELQQHGEPPECPTCEAECSLDQLVKMYPIVQQKEVPESSTTEEEPAKPEEEEPPKPYSLPHLVLSFLEFSIVLQVSFFAAGLTSRARLSETDEEYDFLIEDELLNPRWMMNFYLVLAYGMLIAGAPALAFDLWRP